jgi:hypothetical protein
VEERKSVAVTIAKYQLCQHASCDFLWREGGGMFFEQHPILDALWTIGVFVAAWGLATVIMAFLGYCIHNGL